MLAEMLVAWGILPDSELETAFLAKDEGQRSLWTKVNKRQYGQTLEGISQCKVFSFSSFGWAKGGRGTDSPFPELWVLFYFYMLKDSMLEGK